MCATWDASAEAERAFGSFQRSTVEAMKVLAEAGLYTQLMMIMYGAIDAAGLLDAPLGTIDADGETFRDWVDKYMIPGARLQASAADRGGTSSRAFPLPNILGAGWGCVRITGSRAGRFTA